MQHLDGAPDGGLLAGCEVVAEAPPIRIARARRNGRAAPVHAHAPEARAVDVGAVADRAVALVAIVGVAGVRSLGAEHRVADVLHAYLDAHAGAEQDPAR